MKKYEHYQLTINGQKLAKEITDCINTDFPGAASVRNGCCWITGEYLQKCIKEVLEIREDPRRKNRSKIMKEYGRNKPSKKINKK